MATFTRGVAVIALLAGVSIGTASSASAAPSGPILRGTYALVVTLGTATVPSVATITSDCAQCDAVVTTTTPQTFRWVGAGWENTSDSGCGPHTTVFTPVGRVDGVVQNFAIAFTYLDPSVCPSSPSTGVGTGARTSD